MKMTIKSGDNVLVIAGKDKGKTGKVNAVYADQNKVLVENVNIVTKPCFGTYIFLQITPFLISTLLSLL